MNRPTTLPAIVMLLGILGCATEPPSIDTSATAEVSFDGLYPIRNSNADLAWALPDLDLSGYSKVMLQGAGIEYRPVKKVSSASYASAINSQTEFPLDESQKARLRDIVAEAFTTELEKSEKFTLVNDPGQDVLLVRGALLDVVSQVPPEPIGRSNIFLRSIGEATLVIEIRDSMSEAVLARAIDRRAAEFMGGELRESNRATNTAEVRRVAQRWARLLRTRLDEFGDP